MRVSAAILLAFCYSALASPATAQPATVNNNAAHLERRAPENLWGRPATFGQTGSNRGRRISLERRGSHSHRRRHSHHSLTRRSTPVLERRAPRSQRRRHSHYSLTRRSTPVLERRAPRRRSRSHRRSSSRGRFITYSPEGFNGYGHLHRRAVSPAANSSAHKLERRAPRSQRRRHSHHRSLKRRSVSRGGYYKGYNNYPWLQRRALPTNDAQPAHKLERRSNRHRHGSHHHSLRRRQVWMPSNVGSLTYPGQWGAGYNGAYDYNGYSNGYNYNGYNNNGYESWDEKQVDVDAEGESRSIESKKESPADVTKSETKDKSTAANKKLVRRSDNGWYEEGQDDIARETEQTVRTADMKSAKSGTATTIVGGRSRFVRRGVYGSYRSDRWYGTSRHGRGIYPVNRLVYEPYY